MMPIVDADTQPQGYVLPATPIMPPRPREGELDIIANRPHEACEVREGRRLGWMKKIHSLILDTYIKIFDRVENMDIVGEISERPTASAHRQRFMATDLHQSFLDIWNGTTAVWKQVDSERGLESPTDASGAVTITFGSATRYLAVDADGNTFDEPNLLLTPQKGTSTSTSFYAWIESFTTVLNDDDGCYYYTSADVYVYDAAGAACENAKVHWRVSEAP